MTIFRIKPVPLPYLVRYTDLVWPLAYTATITHSPMGRTVKMAIMSCAVHPRQLLAQHTSAVVHLPALLSHRNWAPSCSIWLLALVLSETFAYVWQALLRLWCGYLWWIPQVPPGFLPHTVQISQWFYLSLTCLPICALKYPAFGEVNGNWLHTLSVV